MQCQSGHSSGFNVSHTDTWLPVSWWWARLKNKLTCLTCRNEFSLNHMDCHRRSLDFKSHYSSSSQELNMLCVKTHFIWQIYLSVSCCTHTFYLLFNLFLPLLFPRPANLSPPSLCSTLSFQRGAEVWAHTRRDWKCIVKKHNNNNGESERWRLEVGGIYTL